MQYNYRWLYAIMTGAVILIAGFFYGAYPKAARIFKLNETNTQLKEKLLSIQASIKEQTQNPKIIASSKPFSLTDLTLSAHLHGVSIQSIEKMDAVLDGMAKLHLIAYGSYSNISSWLSGITKSDSPIALMNYSLKLDKKDQLVFVTDMVIFKTNLFVRHQNQEEAIHESPFCTSENGGVAPTNTGLEALHRLPIRQMKMVGYLADRNRNQALLLLPDGHIVAVSPGFIVGKEQGRVSEVQPHHTVILLPNGQQYIIAS